MIKLRRLYPSEHIKQQIIKEYYTKSPFCIEALEDGNIKLIRGDSSIGSLDEIFLLYSFDNKNWNDWDYAIGTNVIAGQKFYVKAKTENQAFAADYVGRYRCFSITCKANLTGNIMSLLYNEFIDKIELKSSCTFYHLFANCVNLIDISKLFLPATTLTKCCYAYMFSGCTSLIYAPEKLPALILEDNCYECMFYYCESLTYTPELPATQLADACYNAMFYNCRSLIQTPELPAINLANYCYNGMFMNCVNITQIPNLPALILANKQCYCNMFYCCYSLQGIINLPSIKLTYLCYSDMFFECHNLNKAYLYFLKLKRLI